MYWYLLPVAIVIATVYTSTGVSGANFWVPVYVAWIGLDPRVGFWLALVSMLFGSLSGLVGHLRRDTVRFGIVGAYAVVTVPAAAVGAWIAPVVSGRWLTGLFGVFAACYGAALLGVFARLFSAWGATTHRKIHYLTGVVGGLLTGLISVGVGALLLPRVMGRRDLRHHAEAAGTVLAIVFASSLAAAAMRLRPALLEALGSEGRVAGILAFVVPGVLIGGQIGPWVASRIRRSGMQNLAGALLVAIGLLLLLRVLGPV